MPPASRDSYSLPETPSIALVEARPRSLALGLYELTKPRLSFLSVVTALVGYLAALPAKDFWVILHLFCGTALAAGSAAALNQWMERATDARMRRTRDRPIPSGQVTPLQALAWGLGLGVAGVAQLAVAVHPLAALLAAATILTYLLLYTPLKRRSIWATEVGAISGALPPLIGWAAARGTIDGLGWILFGILACWQIPHFLAIAWTYRRDYAEGGFPMLPVVFPDGRRTGRWALATTVLLVAVSLLPVAFGMAGLLYLAVAVPANLWILGAALGFNRPAGRDAAARRLFLVSILYLPALLAALVADRWLF
ncbi:MAG: protoheme IX farnesyltransferase [Puniceicoccaceae bacterium]|nr:MAG: protoheme IX farnesyltransferase [Puniceicoccaceae bacterium]